MYFATRSRAWWILVSVLALVIGSALGVPYALVTAGVANGGGLFKRSISGTHRLNISEILGDVPLIDGHNDLAWNIRHFRFNEMVGTNLTADLRDVPPWSDTVWSQTDLLRLKKGHIGAQFWSAYVPCEAQDKNAVQLAFEQIDVIKRMVDKYPDVLQLATSAQGIIDAHAAGKIASLIGIEGGHAIGNNLGILRIMYDIGVRYMSLTHLCDTPWSEAASDPEKVSRFVPTHAKVKGLTTFGKAVVAEMNRLGMMIDLSAASRMTILDTLETTTAPVIFSHTAAYSICNDSKNVQDDLLRRVAQVKGIAMVSFFNEQITCREKADITDVIAHINHIRKIAGIDHVGLGAEFDGIDKTPNGLEDVSKYPSLILRLAKDPRWSISDLRKLAGGNLLRVFRAVEDASKQLRRAGVYPRETWIPLKDLPRTNNNGSCATFPSTRDFGRN